MPNLPYIQRPLRTLCRSAAMISLLALAATGRAADWEMSLDTRLVSSNAGRSFMDGGLGATRYDRNDSGAQLGRARFALTASLGELWSALAHQRAARVRLAGMLEHGRGARTACGPLTAGRASGPRSAVRR